MDAPLKLVDRGAIREDVWQLLLINCRTPHYLDGDLRAMLGSTRIGMERVAAAEARLLAYATEKLSGVEGLEVVGQAGNKAGVISFTMDGIHPNDIGTLIDHYGIAIRTGHHCAMPAVKYFGLPATARASFGIYNTPQEVDLMVDALERIRSMFE